jgi:hypothetical protein
MRSTAAPHQRESLLRHSRLRFCAELLPRRLKATTANHLCAADPALGANERHTGSSERRTILFRRSLTALRRFNRGAEDRLPTPSRRWHFSGRAAGPLRKRSFESQAAKSEPRIAVVRESRRPTGTGTRPSDCICRPRTGAAVDVGKAVVRGLPVFARRAAGRAATADRELAARVVGSGGDQADSASSSVSFRPTPEQSYFCTRRTSPLSKSPGR